jgi:hypothetical protein
MTILQATILRRRLTTMPAALSTFGSSKGGLPVRIGNG